MDYPGNEKPVTPAELIGAFESIIQAPEGSLVRVFTARVLLCGSEEGLQTAALIRLAAQHGFSAIFNEERVEGRPPVYQYSIVIFSSWRPVISA